MTSRSTTTLWSGGRSMGMSRESCSLSTCPIRSTCAHVHVSGFLFGSRPNIIRGQHTKGDVCQHNLSARASRREQCQGTPSAVLLAPERQKQSISKASTSIMSRHTLSNKEGHCSGQSMCAITLMVCACHTRSCIEK